MKIAFFGYAWGDGGRLDGYMQEVVNAYVGLGYEVDIYLGNYFSADGAVTGLKPGVDLGLLSAFIRGQGYLAAVSINNSMLIPAVVEAMDGRVVSVIVDGFNHLFRHDPADRFAAFRLNARFTCIGSQFERDLLAAVPGIGDRLVMLSPATNGMLFPRQDARPLYPISWIASLPTGQDAEDYMARVADDPAAHALTRDGLEAIEQTGDLAGLMASRGEQVEALLARTATSLRTFEMRLQDMVTARQRIEVVERLARHGLALFGNRAWARASALSKAVFEAYRPGPPVSGHVDLLRIYNSSLISVNLPQSFISESFQYRLLDVMSSNALLVTKRTPAPDLHRVFGKDCPVPMFDTVAELEAICAHFLAHEDERRAIVEACNALVTPEFSFGARCLDYLSLAGATFTPPSAGDLARAGAQILTFEDFV